MLIVPVEKRFEWNRAPFVLFAIVLLNTLIFFFYQSGDGEKYYEAIGEYAELNYLEYEWPIYKNYLQDNPALKDDPELIGELQRAYDDEEWGYVAEQLLLDIDFFPYLREQRANLPPPDDINYWNARKRIDEKVKTISHLAYGLIPKNLDPITLISSQFLHGSFDHLLGNMIFLIICGFAVEAAIGHGYFLLFYLIAGVVAGLLHASLDLSSSTALVGASGSISGVMAMYLGVFQLRRIEFFYWFLIFVGYFRAPALFILPIYIGKELYSYFFTEGSNVAFMAHTGGFIAGALLIFIALKLKPNLLDDDYIEADQQTTPLQHDLNRIYKHLENFNFEAALKGIDAVIANYGNNFELSLLRYKLLQATQNEGYRDAALELLNRKRIRPYQLTQVHQIWRDNPQLQQQLSDTELIDLGWRFTGLEDIKTAEDIFQELSDKGVRGTRIANFATKLGAVSKDLDKPQAKKKYDKLALQLQQDVDPQAQSSTDSAE